MTEVKAKTKSNSLAQQELDKAQEKFDAFDQQVKDMTQDRMNMAPKEDVEPQTKIAQRDFEKNKDIYLKPRRVMSCKAAFNEKFRKEYEYAKEYVQFTAENREIIGESIDLWTKPFAGIPYEYWEVPVNKPIWGPRYLAEQIKRCSYHRLSTRNDVITGADGNGQYFGQMVVDNTVQRLDAIPTNTRKSIFMGANF